jgi:MFS family permease
MQEADRYTREAALLASDEASILVSKVATSEPRPGDALLSAHAAHDRLTMWQHTTFTVRRTLAMLHEFRWELAGTATSWFLFDIVFYANGLFTGTVLNQIGYGASGKPEQLSEADLARIAAGTCIIAAMALPGYFVALWLIDRMGRRPMQLMGFAAMAGLFGILAAALPQLVQSAVPAFIALYGLTFFFSNFGANMTTYVIPAEVFATKAKATCHGISAASGKVGAAVGAAMMSPLLTAYGTDTAGKDKGLQAVLGICAGVALVGLAVSWWLTAESRDCNIEQLDARMHAALERDGLLLHHEGTGGRGGGKTGGERDDGVALMVTPERR